ncbi:hypothetical protein [Ohtaekwangia koreensis]|uniref:Uncharacterized protein n=1 Tax=Ohtaekwangia koreensis TaxID=688867 RepID=A0A1T5J8P6_9BACT|nr:hypothetical protein [Ohtaekwangia koreensis]SKC47785.1 hypothetical protein SAMN05660236_0873 [Ohtaekwangia koreensis]
MKTWTLKAATTKELAALYGLDRKAMARQIKHYESIIGKRFGYFWRVQQILLLFDNIGPPTHFRVIYPKHYYL